MTKEHTDVLVVGAGVVGSAVASGLCRKGRKVTLLDDGAKAFRASLGNFGLVWVQGKGQGARRYAEWCREASERFPAFAAKLEEQTGIDLAFRKPGGLVLCHGEQEYQKRAGVLERLTCESRHGRYDCELLDRQSVQAMLPGLTLGPGITGGSYSPHDGYINPLSLLRALHISFGRQGGQFCPGTAVTDIRPGKKGFQVTTSQGRFRADKLVLAAGNGLPRLAAQVGMKIRVRPEQGQLMVTERVKPCLSIPLSGIQQTADGSFMVGLSNREVGFNTETDPAVLKPMAARVINAFPALAALRVVRSWSSLRILTADGLPVYQESPAHPGAYVITSHSGVTLAPLHRDVLTNWIVDGEPPAEFESFGTRRFDVEKTA